MAPYQIVVWTDYECPACRQLEHDITEVQKALGDSLSVVYHMFPLTGIHPLALPAAVAAICASEQGRFAEMHRVLFGAKLHGDSVDWQALGDSAALPRLAQFDGCIQQSAARAVVEAERQTGADLHLDGTPGLLIADRLQIGGMAAADLTKRLRKARHKLAKLQRAP